MTTIEISNTRGLAELVSNDAGRVIHRLDPDAMHAYEDEGPRFRQAGIEAAAVVIQRLCMALRPAHPAQPLLVSLIRDLNDLGGTA